MRHLFDIHSTLRLPFVAASVSCIVVKSSYFLPTPYWQYCRCERDLVDSTVVVRETQLTELSSWERLSWQYCRCERETQQCTEGNLQESGHSLDLNTPVCVERLRTTSMNLKMVVIRAKIEGGISWIKQESWCYMTLIREETIHMFRCSSSCNYLKLREDEEWGVGMSNVAASGARVQRAGKMAA